MAASKNDAYLAWAEWGEALRMSDVPRIRSAHPDISVETAEAYVIEFKALARLMSDLSEAGGGHRLGNDRVAKYVRARFPFLEESGMNKVLTLIDYYAWHDGYHDSPNLTIDLDEKPGA